MVIELLHEDVEEGENELVIIHRLRITYRRLLLMDDVQYILHFFCQVIGHNGICFIQLGCLSHHPISLWTIFMEVSLLIEILQNSKPILIILLISFFFLAFRRLASMEDLLFFIVLLSIVTELALTTSPEFWKLRSIVVGAVSL